MRECDILRQPFTLFFFLINSENVTTLFCSTHKIRRDASCQKIIERLVIRLWPPSQGYLRCIRTLTTYYFQDKDAALYFISNCLNRTSFDSQTFPNNPRWSTISLTRGSYGHSVHNVDITTNLRVFFYLFWGELDIFFLRL